MNPVRDVIVLALTSAYQEPGDEALIGRPVEDHLKLADRVGANGTFNQPISHHKPAHTLPSNTGHFAILSSSTSF
jgi:hypothetical protein